MEFKIIAIKPLTGCAKKFSKVLTVGEIYYLCNDYTLIGDCIEINKTNLAPENLYTLENGLKVNICAVVGKNGSGKSTIVELIYASIYNASCVTGILSDDENKRRKILPEDGLRASLYYSKGDDYYCLECKGGQVTLYKQKKGKINSMKSLHGKNKLKKDDLKNLFYSIAVNYSHYSLNEMHSSKWLNYLFHKNDGYQTPLVINPFRKDGVIGINNEEQLTLSRIVANLLTIRSGTSLNSELAPGKIVTDVKFTLNKNKVKTDDFLPSITFGLKRKRKEILECIFSYFPVAGWRKHVETNDDNIRIACDYLCQKLYKITKLYRPYQHASFQFLIDHSKSLGIKKKLSDDDFVFSLDRLRKLLEKLKHNPSHINFKFQQTINFLNNYDLYAPIIGTLVPLTNLAKTISEVASENKQDLIMFIPPSFFNINIKFGNKGYLRSLSSGEMQKIYSAASWMYHLINLNSVREDAQAEYIRYNCINFIFDEIELYFHPEMQRSFISDFLKMLELAPIPVDTGVNCIFITHSPFILSDIPNQNVLFLSEKGIPDMDTSTNKTFGANIHELLKSNFFLREGTMGKFAQEKIESLVDFLNKQQDLHSEVWDKENADRFIKMISEPVIKNSLRNLFNLKYKSAIELQAEINSLQKELDLKLKTKNDSHK